MDGHGHVYSARCAMKIRRQQLISSRCLKILNARILIEVYSLGSNARPALLSTRRERTYSPPWWGERKPRNTGLPPESLLTSLEHYTSTHARMWCASQPASPFVKLCTQLLLLGHIVHAHDTVEMNSSPFISIIKYIEYSIAFKFNFLFGAIMRNIGGVVHSRYPVKDAPTSICQVLFFNYHRTCQTFEIRKQQSRVFNKSKVSWFDCRFKCRSE